MKRAVGILAVLAAVALAFILERTTPGRRVQVASGNDALSVAFGGAKEAVSQAMYEKADRYFHGGIDFDCSDCTHAHGHECERGHAHAREGHAHEHAHGQKHETAFPDPWAWINARIRAPEIERHLEGTKAVEMLPWFWAAIRSNPKNIAAWASAWYAADTIMGDRALAARILEEGRKSNPESLELAFCLARFTYDRGCGDAVAAEKAFVRAREIGLRACGGDLARLNGSDGDTYCFILNYLANFAEQRGERTTLAGYLNEVERTGVKTPVADTIRARIRRLAK